MDCQVNKRQRLPLGSLLRDESTGSIYFLIKAEVYSDRIVYNLCCILDTSLDNQSAPLTFNFLIDDEKANKMTVLNTDIKTGTDGNTVHSLSLLPINEVETLSKNSDFMLRFLTACKFYTFDKKTYNVVGIEPGTDIVYLTRKTSWVERVVTGAEYLGYIVSWDELLDKYIPYIPPNLDEQAYMQSLKENCYFCKGIPNES